MPLYPGGHFLSVGSVDSEGALRYTTPDGGRATEARPDVAQRLQELARRLAPFETGQPGWSGCLLRFHGEGQEQPSPADVTEIRRAAGC